MSVLNSNTQELLNRVARGEALEDKIVMPDGDGDDSPFHGLLKLGVVRFYHSSGTWTPIVTDLGWSFVTCSRALALKRLKDAPPTDATQSTFARDLFAGMFGDEGGSSKEP